MSAHRFDPMDNFGIPVRQTLGMEEQQHREKGDG